MIRASQLIRILQLEMGAAGDFEVVLGDGSQVNYVHYGAGKDSNKCVIGYNAKIPQSSLSVGNIKHAAAMVEVLEGM